MNSVHCRRLEIQPSNQSTNGLQNASLYFEFYFLILSWEICHDWGRDGAFKGAQQGSVQAVQPIFWSKIFLFGIYLLCLPIGLNERLFCTSQREPLQFKLDRNDDKRSPLVNELHSKIETVTYSNLIPLFCSSFFNHLFWTMTERFRSALSLEKCSSRLPAITDRSWQPIEWQKRGRQLSSRNLLAWLSI